MASPFGVYVHVPFCRHRCDYCAFATYTDRDHLMARYVDACVTEIGRAAAEPGGLRAATSVYFGGGTPSRLEPAELLRILHALPVAPGAEVTVECNPEDIGTSRLAAYREGGVTRLSVGVQSTTPHVLGSLGRRHDPGSLTGLARTLRDAGFDDWSLDLILGAATESDQDWERSLHDAVEGAAPPHLSVYSLTVEPGTPLAADPSRHPDDDVQARRYERADQVLAAAGYRWEEISNWARPGHECRHNNLYWSQGNYRGFGSAAHSHHDGRRWWNLRTPDRYVAAVEAGRNVEAGQEALTEAQRAAERLALSLRTPAGVPTDALAPGPDLDGDGDQEPLVHRAAGRAVLTLRGRLLANVVTARLRVPLPELVEPVGSSR